MAGRTRKLTQKTFARKLVIVKFGDNAFDVAAAEKQQDQEEAGRNHDNVFHDNPDANCQPNHNAKTGPPRVYF